MAGGPAGPAAPTGKEGRPRVNDQDSACPDSYKVTSGELRQFIERIERLEQKKKDLAEQVREVYAESKARGYEYHH